MKKLVLFISIAFAFTANSLFAQDDVRLGIAGPHTGQYAAFGLQLWNGASEAIKFVNIHGGIAGKKVVAVKADDACEPKQAVNVANKIVDVDEVDGVIGHFCSSSTIPASEVYDEAGLVQITPASTNPQVTERGLPNIFRTCSRDDLQGKVAGDFLVNGLNLKRIAVIHDKDTYGQGLADQTMAVVQAMGVEPVLYEGLTRGEKDFNALVTKIKSLNVDGVYFGGLHTEAGILVKQMREQGINVPFVSGDGIVSEDFYTVSGGKTDNVYMTFLADPTANPNGERVVKNFKARGYEPEGFTLFSYAAVEVLAEALNKTAKDGELDYDAAGEYIHNNTFSTILGDITFDDKGDPSGKYSSFVVYKWNGNKYSMIN